MKLNTRQFFKFLRIAKKVNLKELVKDIDFTSMTSNTQNDNSVYSKIGISVIATIVPELEIAEQELYEFIADVKQLAVNDLENLDFMEIVNTLIEIVKSLDFGSFLKQATK
jgi:glutathionylspermidine synthase